ncbi:methyl-accepting chemotaxis protein [Fervidobacterium sp.]
MKMRLSWSYALTLTLLIASWTVLIILMILPRVSEVVATVTKKSFLEEVRFLSKMKAYEAIFQEKPEFGYYYLVDKDGNTVNHHDPSKIGLNVQKELPELFKYMETKKEGIYSYEYQGVRRYVGFAFNGEYYIAHAVTHDELFDELENFLSTFYRLLLPLIIVLTPFSGYIIGEFMLRKPRQQLKASNVLVKNISENIIQTSSSASEIKAMAENAEGAATEVDSSLEEFAAYLEESRAETEATIKGLNEFTDTIEQITEYTSKLAMLTETLGKITDNITDISDNITVLAINVSIETSKQNIDREGLSRIAEMIMELSNSTRNLAKESKQSLLNVENIVTSTTLITEKITKKLSSVRGSLSTIEQVSIASTTNVEKLVKASKTAHESVEELYSGIEQLEEAIANIKEEIDKFTAEISKFML